MNVQQIIGAKVVDKQHGSTAGHVKGLLIDAESKKVTALAIGDKGSRVVRYLPFEDAISIEHDVVMIESPQVLIDRGHFKAMGILDQLQGRTVLTENGRDLGTVQSYDVDEYGLIQSIQFGRTTSALSGLWRKSHETHEISTTLVKTIGEHVLVDNSVPDVVEHEQAA